MSLNLNQHIDAFKKHTLKKAGIAVSDVTVELDDDKKIKKIISGDITKEFIYKPDTSIVDKEIIRVFRKMPKFYPAEHRGKWIKCRVVVPFRFEVKARKRKTTLISDPVISIKNNY